MVYLDHNATTQIDGRVLDAMMPYLEGNYGNPSSVHHYGRMARAAIDQAREQVAGLVNAHPSQVLFTSGGTEANNLALKGYAAGQAAWRAPGHIAHSAVEHASVLEPLQVLARQGWSVDAVPVDGSGLVTCDALTAVLRPDTMLVTVMMANNETGVMLDVAGLAEAVKEAGAVLHTDAVQAAGKVPVDFRACGVQLMTLSAHKIYGPKGAGALIVDKSLELEPLLNGGAHEKGMRAGTENVAGIVGFGAAAELARQELNSRAAHMGRLREYLEQQLQTLPGIVVFGAEAPRVPNTVQIGVPGIDGEALLMNLDREGIAVSAGSACSSGSVEPSHVLMAMGVEPSLARSAVRISLGKDTGQRDVDLLLEALRKQVQQLAGNPAWAVSN
jgi:cysteine desulfurase